MAAPTEFEGLLSDVTSLQTTLTNFANNIAGYLANPSIVPLNFSEVVPGISLDNLITKAKISANGLSGFSRGAVTSTAYKIAGIQRESTIVTMTKSNIYSTAELALGTVPSISQASAGLTTNMIRNSTPRQN